MSSTAVVGMQWGDEGKGKVVDLLAKNAQHIARAQGGNNAGHTILIGSSEFRFHLVPSGILYPEAKCYIGGGTVVDPESLLKEIGELERQGISIEDRLFLSEYAHVVFPYHRQLDQLAEKRKGSSAIGTTGRGIGPCYVDKVRRIGIRVAELIDPDLLRTRLEATLPLKNEELEKIYGAKGFSLDEIYPMFVAYGKKLKPFVAPVEDMLSEAHARRETILFEGAQGAFLDGTFGTFPYVTSSCTLAGGVSTGLGIGPRRIDKVLGVTKAYTTRVGHGPLPTELNEREMAQFPSHVESREVGTTTGRKRRMGWLDIPLLRQAVRLNGPDALALMKLDILDRLPEIQVCVDYAVRGSIVRSFPSTVEALSEAVPVYERCPGWMCSTRDCSSYDALPANAKKYLRKIEQWLGLPIELVSVGPEREKTVRMDFCPHEI